MPPMYTSPSVAPYSATLPVMMFSAGTNVEPRGGILVAAVAALADIHDGAAADGDDGREHADDEAVSRQ